MVPAPRSEVTVTHARGTAPLELGDLFDGYTLYRTVRDGTGAIIDFECIDAGQDGMLFMPVDQQVGRMMSEMFPFVTENGTLERYIEVAETGKPWHGESRYTIAGTEYLLDIRIARSGDVLIVGFNDILEKAHAQESAARRTADYVRLAENLPDAVVVLDGDLRIRYVNPAAEVAWQPDLPLGEVITEHLRTVIMREALLTVARTGQPKSFRSSWQDRYHEVRIIPEVDEDQRLASALIISRDITAERQALIDQQEFDSRMHRTARLESLGVLAAGIAHDFNNLLVGILGNTELAMLDLPPDSPLLPLMSGVTAAAEIAAELTAQMLAYAGRRALNAEPLDVSPLVADTLNLVRSSMARSAQVHRDLAIDLPPVLGDPGQLTQVVMNLVINASEALHDGAGTICVRTALVELDASDTARLSVQGALEPGSYVTISVSDTGVGMDAETLARLYEPFYSTRPLGRGLGMAVVHGVVSQHHGAITASSTVGTGSEITVFLPVHGAKQTSAVPPVDRPGRTVLLVDDDDAVRLVAGRMLERSGLNVISQSDGRTALDVLSRSPEVSLVLLDVSMPGMSGIEVLTELRATDTEIPVIMMSGYSDVSPDGGTGALPITAFLHKPFRAAALIEAIEAALGGPS